MLTMTKWSSWWGVCKTTCSDKQAMLTIPWMSTSWYLELTLMWNCKVSLWELVLSDPRSFSVSTWSISGNCLQMVSLSYLGLGHPPLSTEVCHCWPCFMENQKRLDSLRNKSSPILCTHSSVFLCLVYLTMPNQLEKTCIHHIDCRLKVLSSH